MKGALQGKKINIMAMGCRSNQSEADSLASMLKRTGAEIVKAPPYDAAVLITCTVTAIADKKSRQLLRRLRRQSPE
ncbi:MAG: tRNA modifying enzyme, partial [Aminobacterium colombiense]|nr:tRNA modifying enzyme [Aminobacterium colombiense]